MSEPRNITLIKTGEECETNEFININGLTKKRGEDNV